MPKKPDAPAQADETKKTEDVVDTVAAEAGSPVEQQAEPKKEEVVPEPDAPAQADEQMEVGAASVTVLTKPTPKQTKDHSLIKIKSMYPEDHKGKKYLVEGNVYEVSSATAEQLVKKGLAVKV